MLFPIGSSLCNVLSFTTRSHYQRIQTLDLFKFYMFNLSRFVLFHLFIHFKFYVYEKRGLAHLIAEIVCEGVFLL